MWQYSGSELLLFASATNWKRYVATALAPYIAKNVLEVGAGLGFTTRALRLNKEGQWTCLEPDPEMARHLATLVAAGDLGTDCSVIAGRVADLPGADWYDSVVYIDVLEHIQDDKAELAAAARHLLPGGTLIVLSPAFPWLFTAFDAAIGHYRRYTRKTLLLLAPPNMEPVCSFYLDSVGVLASLANAMLLKRNAPKESQILFWDKVMVPVSRLIDPLIGRSFGRSVVCVWRKR